MALLATVLLAGCGNAANSNTSTEGTNTMQEDNYKPDSTLRILMVGNSFCYYYVEARKTPPHKTTPKRSYHHVTLQLRLLSLRQ